MGLRHRASIKVGPDLTVPAMKPAFPGFGDMPPVFATLFMVGFIEATCVEALRPFLEDGQGTVGTHVDMSHGAATPVGGTVTAAVELVAVEGRRLRFRIECHDDRELIGAGWHERFIIDVSRFNARVVAKAG